MMRVKKVDPPSALGGLMGFLVEGDVKKLNSVLKRPTQRSGWAKKMGSTFVLPFS